MQEMLTACLFVRYLELRHEREERVVDHDPESRFSVALRLFRRSPKGKRDPQPDACGELKGSGDESYRAAE